MAVTFTRPVEFAMLDAANIAYYPRIFDLSHRFFEQCWLEMCDISYPDLFNIHRVGFPIVSIESDFTTLIYSISTGLVSQS